MSKTNKTKTRMALFTATVSERKIIAQIADRAKKLAPNCDAIGIIMDLEATHCSGCPLDLEMLLNADNITLAHDVFGINRRLDRTTGKLGGFFVPRCRKRRKTSTPRARKEEISHE
jgi:hypothetical protein